MKIYNVFFLVFLLTGCTGDTLVFRNQGDARIDKNGICIKSSSGDVLSYYSVSSTLDNYKEPIAISEASKKFPDTCIKVEIKESADYDFVYILNDENYRLNFTVDKDGVVHKSLM